MRTISQTAAAWGVTRSAIQRLIVQGRLRVQKFGAITMVLDEERPPKAARGTLTPEQRAAWKTKNGNGG